MGKIFIVCPECGQQLSFNEVPGYQNMVVQCPKCFFKANASVYKSGAQARGGAGMAQDMPTQIVAPPKSTFDVGQIRVLATNEIEWLKEGSNVIGRRAVSGTADIKISNDPYMSRRHIQINVVKKPFGYEHQLSVVGTTNLPLLNGTEVQPGEILPLKFGDIITLGKTQIKLESNNDESTRLG